MMRLIPWLVLALGTGLAALLPIGFPQWWAINAGGVAAPLVVMSVSTAVLELVARREGRLKSYLPQEWAARVEDLRRNSLYILSTTLNLFISYLVCTLPLKNPGLPVAFCLLLVSSSGYPLYHACRYFAQAYRHFRGLRTQDCAQKPG